MAATERKSKLKYLVETSYDNTLDMRKQQPYMNTNNRGECSAIFSTRTLMLKVKKTTRRNMSTNPANFAKPRKTRHKRTSLKNAKNLKLKRNT